MTASSIASTAPGAWTCRACGFRGFWSDGFHCDADRIRRFAGLTQKMQADIDAILAQGAPDSRAKS